MDATDEIARLPPPPRRVRPRRREPLGDVVLAALFVGILTISTIWCLWDLLKGNLVLSFVIFALYLLAGIAAVVWDRSTRQRVLRLLRDGEVAVAVITDMRGPAKGWWKVGYLFHVADLAAGPGAPRVIPVQATMRVSFLAFEAVSRGDRVVVFYDPQRPQRSVLYRFTYYDVAPA